MVVHVFEGLAVCFVALSTHLQGRRQLKHELEIAHNEKKALELRIQALMKGSTDTSSKSSEGNSTRRRLFPLFGRNEKSLSSADYYNVSLHVSQKSIKSLTGRKARPEPKCCNII